MRAEENYLLYLHLNDLRKYRREPIEWAIISYSMYVAWKEFYESKPQEIDLILNNYTNDGIYKYADTSGKYGEFKKELSRLEYDNLKMKRELIKAILEEIEYLLIEVEKLDIVKNNRELINRI